MLSLELISSTLPPGKKIIFNVQDEGSLEQLKQNPIYIKEGAEFKYVNEKPA